MAVSGRIPGMAAKDRRFRILPISLRSGPRPAPVISLEEHHQKNLDPIDGRVFSIQKLYQHSWQSRGFAATEEYYPWYCKLST
jgi:hypothetical protein